MALPSSDTTTLLKKKNSNNITFLDYFIFIDNPKFFLIELFINPDELISIKTNFIIKTPKIPNLYLILFSIKFFLSYFAKNKKPL